MTFPRPNGESSCCAEQKILADKLLCEWIVAQPQPFSTVEHPKFVLYSKILNSDYRPPTRQTLRNKVKF